MGMPNAASGTKPIEFFKFPSVLAEFSNLPSAMAPVRLNSREGSVKNPKPAGFAPSDPSGPSGVATSAPASDIAFAPIPFR
jgi:hypothetical protein